MKNKKYINVARNFMINEFSFINGYIYYGTKIDVLLKEKPLLSKVLIPVEDYPFVEKNYQIYDGIVEDIIGGK